MADPDSDEEETFVVIGTPLEVYEEDEVPKMPVAAHQQVVKDRQGRQRFHGAFTGGFSAGYFNTVGSLEGFTPSTFVSSRNKKADSMGLRPEDFMDEDDLDEFGIAPRAVATTSDFTSTRPQKRPATSSGSLIPGDLDVLSRLVLPAKLPIGVKLLRGLGWKEGQGIGPRVKKKVKVKAPPGEKKVYGCALPSQESEESSSEDEYAQGLSFAPKDVTPISFKPKDDSHGIGYRGIDPSLAMGATRGLVDLFEQPAVTKTGRRGITGQAFGVGALEDDDDDIYGTDSMSKYDRVLGEERDHLHGWTAPSARRNKPSRFGDKVTMNYVSRVLEGFKLASASLQPKKIYPPPRVPRDYRPMHVFAPTEVEGFLTTRPAEGSRIDASARSIMIGDVESVFDLVSKADKEKIAAAKSKPSAQPDTSSRSQLATDPPGTDPITAGIQIFQPPNQTAGIDSSSAPRPAPSIPTGVPQDPSQGKADFKPFAKDAPKQQRYEAYLALKKEGKTDELVRLQPNMTEWERERERAEFVRAEQLYRPLSLLMASRFHRAEYDDDKEAAGPLTNRGKEQTDEEKAAGCKMYGRLTRQAYEWHPDRLLCKRFNIPDPYPSSTIVGLPVTRRDKYSVFDFLTPKAPSVPPPPPPDPEPTLASIAKKEKPKVGPLAILNKPTQPQTTSQPSETTTPAAAEVLPGTGQAKTETVTARTIAPQGNQDPSSLSDRPPMDLFRAIFDDSSDSDSSSSSDESTRDDDVTHNDVTPSDVIKADASAEGASTSRQGLSNEDSKDVIDVTGLSQRQDKPTSEEKETHSLTSNEGPQPTPNKGTVTPARRADGKVGIFDVLNAQIQRDKEAGGERQGDQETPLKTLAGGTPGTDVSGEQPSEFYGPLPPPARDGDNSKNRATSPASSHKKHKHKKEKKKDRKRDRSRSRSKSRERDRNRDRRRDRSRERDRSNSRERRKESQDRDRKEERRKEREDSAERQRKRKKDDKSKDKKKKKKSKHKKKSKSKKSKKARSVSSDSEDADSESSGSESDKDEAPTNAQILQRLMMLKKKP